MNSSYLSKLDFGDLLKVIAILINPNKIVEFGILDGFSLKAFADSNNNCIIEGYDIFEDFVGNSSNLNTLTNVFKDTKNVSIKKGDFYKSVDLFEDQSIDIIHIDIANNGDVYEFAIENYIQKLSPNGIMLLEGGSEERDNVGWMAKYNKPKIQPILEKYNSNYKINTIDKFPSITIIQNK
jgi:predicted O-methyltransferase YrrM